MKEYIKMLNESVSTEIFQKYIETIENYANNKQLYVHKNHVNPIVIDGGRYYGVFIFSTYKNNGAMLLWEQSGNHQYLNGIAFTDDANKVWNSLLFGGKVNFTTFVRISDMSLAQLLPYICDAIKNNNINSKQVQYELFELVTKYSEGLNESQVFETTLADLKRDRRHYLSRIEHFKNNNKINKQHEYEKKLQDVDKQIASITFSVNRNVSGTITGDINEVRPQEQEYENRATPEERFSDMERYINMVIKGLQPSLLICGAPGVGKTFRVLKKIKESGLNYKVIKGKETSLACYQDLFLYSRENDILIFDDADEVLENDVITNLLKAATDSSDDRIVSYGTSKPPIMPDYEYEALPPELKNQCGEQDFKNGIIYTYPKFFITEGRIIIITNKSAGMVDTAIKNRALICDLEFTTEECLHIIKDIMPAIMPGKIGISAKLRALEFLENLAKKGSMMEISIRSFTTVAKVFEDVTDTTQAERMIREQMSLQSLRGGKKY